MPMCSLTLFKRRIRSAFGVSHAYMQADAVPLRRDAHVYTQPEKPAGFGISVKRTGASPSYQGHPLPNEASLMGLPLA